MRAEVGDGKAAQKAEGDLTYPIALRRSVDATARSYAPVGVTRN
jgi:hypothetical protein